MKDLTNGSEPCYAILIDSNGVMRIAGHNNGVIFQSSKGIMNSNIRNYAALAVSKEEMSNILIKNFKDRV